MYSVDGMSKFKREQESLRYEAVLEVSIAFLVGIRCELHKRLVPHRDRVAPECKISFRAIRTGLPVTSRGLCA